jgi:hypothetical protein
MQSKYWLPMLLAAGAVVTVDQDLYCHECSKSNKCNLKTILFKITFIKC